MPSANNMTLVSVTIIVQAEQPHTRPSPPPEIPLRWLQDALALTPVFTGRAGAERPRGWRWKPPVVEEFAASQAT